MLSLSPCTTAEDFYETPTKDHSQDQPSFPPQLSEKETSHSIADISESYPTSENSFHSSNISPHNHHSTIVDENQPSYFDQFIQAFDELIIDKLVMGLLTPRRRERHSLNHSPIPKNLILGGNRKSTQSMPSTPLSNGAEEDTIKIMLLSGENWGVGQSSIAKRFVLNQFGEEEPNSNFISKYVTKHYTKEVILKVAQTTENNPHVQHQHATNTIIHHIQEEKKENITEAPTIYYTNSASARHSNGVGLSSDKMSYLTTINDQNNASPSTNSLLSNTSSVSASAESLLHQPRTVTLQIEDYTPPYITELETTDDRLSTCDSLHDEEYFLEFKKKQQDYYYEKDVFLICFDGKYADFLNYVYNEIDTIRTACDEFTEYKVIILVLTKQDKDIPESSILDSLNDSPHNLISEEKREKMIEKLLEDSKLELFRVSSKDNFNIQELFDYVSEKALIIKERKLKLKAKLKRKIDSHAPSKHAEKQKHKCSIQ